MAATYPTPATPLPWVAFIADNSTDDDAKDTTYLVRAANAFPHLVVALESVLHCIPPGYRGIAAEVVLPALAIARGEMAT